MRRLAVILIVLGLVMIWLVACGSSQATVVTSAAAVEETMPAVAASSEATTTTMATTTTIANTTTSDGLSFDPGTWTKRVLQLGVMGKEKDGDSYYWTPLALKKDVSFKVDEPAVGAGRNTLLITWGALSVDRRATADIDHGNVYALTVIVENFGPKVEQWQPERYYLLTSAGRMYEAMYKKDMATGSTNLDSAKVYPDEKGYPTVSFQTAADDEQPIGVVYKVGDSWIGGLQLQ